MRLQTAILYRLLGKYIFIRVMNSKQKKHKIVASCETGLYRYYNLNVNLHKRFFKV